MIKLNSLHHKNPQSNKKNTIKINKAPRINNTPPKESSKFQKHSAKANLHSTTTLKKISFMFKK